jgi:hypothetical protein
MTPTLLLEAITAQTYSRSDLAYRISLIREFLEYVFFVKRDAMVGSDAVEAFSVYSKKPLTDIAFLHALPQTFLQAFTQASLYKTLEQLADESQKLLTLSLTVPVALARGDIEAIGKWMHQEVDSHVLIAVAVDPGVAVGCRVGWGNQLYDFSFDHFLAAAQKPLQERYKALSVRAPALTL